MVRFLADASLHHAIVSGCAGREPAICAALSLGNMGAVGPWLPEPVDTSADPRLGAERGQALAFGVLLLLEKLTPTERAAYILREAFDYPYRDIANVLRLEEANARQVVTRARQRVANGRTMPATSTEQGRLLGAFIAAARHGDVAGLEGVLASDVVSTSAGAFAA